MPRKRAKQNNEGNCLILHGQERKPPSSASILQETNQAIGKEIAHFLKPSEAVT